ncbi:MAG TPA: aminomethyl-transferring glycine dehydrogenase subunit GcvPA [candidate division Zixibacteria bacterium]|nr:aminomethyl-transferring glycine dehydrogenase subunit GcvPA [candidate division Zixibacteria bacterium]
MLDKRSYPYIPNSVADTKREMMHELGIKSIDELYADVPEKYRLKKELNLPEKPLSEFEVRRHVEALLSKNKPCNTMPVFLGAGCWPHYIPAVVQEIVSRSEFLTSYTPYQPEVSQGMLQALFEYQSMICELTGMEVSNCSMYDWASALGEAARMAARFIGRNEILVPRIIHPERAATLQLYAEPAGITVKQVGYSSENGQLDLNDLKNKISEQTAAVYVENPSYLGCIESQVEDISKEVHSHNSLLIVGVDPISLGILKPPGEYDADIVVGEAQPLGNGMNFGGPLLGIMACRDDMSLIRQMPGRIIGLTTTQDNSRQGFCMALQTREQHIRREKATSNICTNEALCAVASAVYMALLGPEGFRQLAEAIMYKAKYAMRMLSKIKGVRTPVFKSAHFKEFTVNFDETGLKAEEISKKLLRHQVHGGKDVSKEFPELGQTGLYCVTEIHSRQEIERLRDALEGALEDR